MPIGCEQMNLKSKRGTAVTEFLVVVPIMVFLLFGGLYIHEKIEDELSTAIAGRNLAFTLNDPNAQIAGIKYDMVELSHRRDVTQQSFQMSPIQSDNTHILQLKSADYTLEGFVDRHSSHHQKELDKIEHSLVENDATFQTLSNSLGTLGASLNPVLDGLKNPGGLELMPLDRPGRHLLRVTSQKGLGNFAARLKDALYLIGGDHESYDTFFKADSLQSIYSRNEAGYFPHKYKFQAVLAYFLGKQQKLKHWYDPTKRHDPPGSVQAAKIAKGKLSLKIPDGFVAECLMHFTGNSRCRKYPPRIDAAVVRLIGAGKGALDVILQIFTGGGMSAINKVAKELVKSATAEVSGKLVSEVTAQITTKIGQKGQEQITQKFDQIVDGKRQQVMNQMTKFYQGSHHVLKE